MQNFGVLAHGWVIVAGRWIDGLSVDRRATKRDLGTGHRLRSVLHRCQRTFTETVTRTWDSTVAYWTTRGPREEPRCDGRITFLYKISGDVAPTGHQIAFGLGDE